MLHHLPKIVLQQPRQFAGIFAGLVIKQGRRQHLAEFVDQFDGNSREIVDEVERILDLMNVERRAADHLQHVGGRGLLLQRFSEVIGLRPDLVEQPRVLDRDHRLIGKRRDQLDLLPGERLRDRTAGCNHADGDALAQKRNAEHGAEVAAPDRFSPRVIRIGQHVRNVNDAACERRLANQGVPAGRDLLLPHPVPVVGSEAMARCKAVFLAVAAEDEAIRGIR